MFSFIAESITSSVRALEGSLIRILAYASYNNLNPEELDVETVRSILSDMISEQHKEITLDTITQEVCLAYNITMPQIVDKTRRQQISYPRQIAMYLANLLIPQLSLKEIAEYYKRKDHTTVIHAKRMIENRFREDINFRSHIEQLIKNIKS